MAAGDDDITLGEISRQVTKLDEVVTGIWRELKEIRSGFVSQRTFEDYCGRAEKDLERVSTDIRQQLNGATSNLRGEIGAVNGKVDALRGDLAGGASRRFSVVSSLFVAVVAAGLGAILTALLTHHG